MVPTRPHRSLVGVGSTLLALGLAFGTVAGAVARDVSDQTRPNAGVVSTIAAAAGTRVDSTWVDPEPEPRYDGRSVRVLASQLRLGPRLATGQAAAARAATTASAHHGRNHVWMPALGIDRSISFYSCSNRSYPGNRVYRWGCAGSNNVYLFGHADSVFKPLHDAYVRSRLKKGMKLFYADGNGTVRTYKVAWWKLTTATKGTWAYKALSRPSLTLQTCVGARSQYRLIVRLVQVD